MTASASISAASTKPAASASAAVSASPATSAAGSTAASAKPAAASGKPAASAAPVVGNLFTIQATEYKFDAPDSIPGGLTTIRLTDVGKQPHEAQLFRLNSGVTGDQFQTALKNPNPAGALKLSTATGGVAAVDPGTTAESIMDLQPGQYYLLCFLPDANGVPHFVHGMLKAFTVTKPSAAAASPQASTTVTLKDFTFEMPATLPAGATIVKVTNEGPQPHQMEIARLAPGKTAQDVTSFFASQPSGPPPASAVAAAASGSAAPASAAPPARPEAPASGKLQAAPGPPPFQALGGMNGLSKGESGWAVLNLTPGDYVAFCAIPDISGSLKPHIDLGMIKAFTVK